MNDDPLAPLLTYFSARARLFFTGNLCGHVTFSDAKGVGYLHLLRAGETRLHDGTGYSTTLSEPTLLFYSRPLTHWFDPDAGAGADLACASVDFENKAFNPIALALPPRFQCSLSELEDARPVLAVLFAEAFTNRPARQEVLNRLFEVVLIELLRITVARGLHASGFLRGLAHPQLSKALTAIHSDPAREWTLETLADSSGMSRSAFAAAFKQEVGETPGDYLTRWRITAAQALLRAGTPLKSVAERVGYASQAGFLRAFKLVVGTSPTVWRRANDARDAPRGSSRDASMPATT
jgi:AraC-like DNA-binding protein